MTYILLTVIAGYAAIVVLFALMQDKLVYPRAGGGDRGVGYLPQTSEVTVSLVTRSDGGRSRIVRIEPVVESVAVALYFVGNGEDLTSAAAGGAVLAEYGITVFGVEHAGYGSSDGPTTVATLMAGAEAAAAHAAVVAKERSLPLFAVGSSLGTFCATHVAALGLVERLLLRAPPTTLAAAAKERFGFLPVDLFLRHRFDNLGKADAIKCPVLIVHGDGDGIVPLVLGRKLCEAIGAHCRLIVGEGYGHNDLPLAIDGPFGEAIREHLLGR